MITLDQTFVHSTPTHSFQIKWTHLGSHTAPPLVFIHGTPWSSYEWHTLALALSSRYSIFLYDHPGFGSSPSPRRLSISPSTDTAADPSHALEDLDPSLTLRAIASAALITSWNLSTPPHVVAHDNGGLVSLRLLLQHSISFASLCLIDVVALTRTEPIPFFELVASNQGVFNAIPAHLIEGFIASYVAAAAFKPLDKEVKEALVSPWREGGSQGPKKFLEEMVQAQHRDVGEIEGEYGRVGGLVPTRIIWGKEDAWVPASTAERLAKALGLDVEEVVLVEEAGHLCMFDQPIKVAVEVALWLEKNRN